MWDILGKIDIVFGVLGGIGLIWKLITEVRKHLGPAKLDEAALRVEQAKSGTTKHPLASLILKALDAAKIPIAIAMVGTFGFLVFGILTSIIPVDNLISSILSLPLVALSTLFLGLVIGVLTDWLFSTSKAPTIGAVWGAVILTAVVVIAIGLEGRAIVDAERLVGPTPVSALVGGLIGVILGYSVELVRKSRELTPDGTWLTAVKIALRDFRRTVEPDHRSSFELRREDLQVGTGADRGKATLIVIAVEKRRRRTVGRYQLSIDLAGAIRDYDKLSLPQASVSLFGPSLIFAFVLIAVLIMVGVKACDTTSFFPVLESRSFTPTHSVCVMPSFVRKEEASAVQEATRLGFQPHLVSQYDPSVPAGVVISQNPAAGSISEHCEGNIELVISNSGKGVVFLDEEFSNVQEGYLPDGWIGNDSLVVRNQYGQSFLTNVEGLPSSELVFTVNSVVFPENYRLEWTLQQVRGCGHQVSVGGVDVSISMCWPLNIAAYYDYVDYRIGESSKRVKGNRMGELMTIALEKRGDVFWLYAENEQIAFIRKSGSARPDSFSFAVEPDFRLFQITGTDLGQDIN